MLDAVNLERRGIPAVVVVVEQFVEAAKANARAQGMPDLAMVVIPQDYLVEDETRVRATVEPLVGEMLERLFVAP
ncbi:MAG: hypothetical protein WCI50_01945 [Actinomycetes bacterium]